MAAAVITVTRPSGTRGFALANKKARFFDITADTGDYAANGFTVTAAQFGMKYIDFVQVGSAATQGTDGASAQIIGVRYTGGSSVRFQVYESAASGAPPLEKTAEAYVANFTFRVMVIGW